MFIDPGAYTIQNVTHGNYAVQRNGSVVGYANYTEGSMGDDGIDLVTVWSISRLDNSKYTIRNIATNDYAASVKFPTIEENLITTRNLHQWAIKETAVKGRYVICTTGAHIDLFWGLPDGELDTPVSLRDRPNTPSNQWEVTKVDLWEVVGALRVQLIGYQNEDKSLRENNQKLLGEHLKLLDEHTRLQDEHAKLQVGAERLNADVVNDARQERERLVQAEAELKASYETASRRERARHLQAEAALKESYEKLLADSVPKSSQRRCIFM
ncbi:hypothetical protein BD410DRAFT_899111 [Rickenella mellea]|uniref:Ricin B lectin domain-containing protein n=1 Tax=Rickenella mellea TaxID=50990 RepID=A0A4Y7Q079_9AGAM|nr:hypothetical protein BD410DRAFT_899111 [Rickenella mellea]